MRVRVQVMVDYRCPPMRPRACRSLCSLLFICAVCFFLSGQLRTFARPHYKQRQDKMTSYEYTVLFAMVVKTRMYACTFALCNVQSSRQPTEQDRCCIRFKVVLDSKSDTTTTTKITTQPHYISHYAYGYPLLSHYYY